LRTLIEQIGGHPPPAPVGGGLTIGRAAQARGDTDHERSSARTTRRAHVERMARWHCVWSPATSSDCPATLSGGRPNRHYLDRSLPLPCRGTDRGPAASAQAPKSSAFCRPTGGVWASGPPMAIGLKRSRVLRVRNTLVGHCGDPHRVRPVVLRRSFGQHRRAPVTNLLPDMLLMLALAGSMPTT
jgi:hypothetical protein